jgi:hypothetical protein
VQTPVLVPVPAQAQVQVRADVEVADESLRGVVVGELGAQATKHDIS